MSALIRVREICYARTEVEDVVFAEVEVEGRMIRVVYEKIDRGSAYDWELSFLGSVILVGDVKEELCQDVDTEVSSLEELERLLEVVIAMA